MEWTFETLEDGLRVNLNRIDLQTASGIDLTGWSDYYIVQEVLMDHPTQTVTATLAAQARSRTRRGG
jgi:hypothetical protein